METLRSVFDTENPNVMYYWAAGAGVLLTSAVICKLLRGSPKQAPPEGPPDTVILHQFGRGPGAPSLSPFVLKLETYLRIAKIPYQPKLNSTFGKKGKLPWIQYNKEEIADSEFCMAFLNTTRGVDLNKNLTDVEKAVARGFQIMVDEHSYWTLMYFRWVYEKDMRTLKDNVQMPIYAWWIITRTLRQELWAQGIGRHTMEEIKGKMMSDLKALSDYLGNKPFLMGDKPCQEDAAIFGFLAQLVFIQKDEDLGNLVQDNFPNLARYCLRMKEEFWPDWEDCIMKK